MSKNIAAMVLAAIMVFYFVPATHYCLRWWWKEFFGKGEGS